MREHIDMEQELSVVLKKSSHPLVVITWVVEEEEKVKDWFAIGEVAAV